MKTNTTFLKTLTICLFVALISFASIAFAEDEEVNSKDLICFI